MKWEPGAKIGLIHEKEICGASYVNFINYILKGAIVYKSRVF